MGMTETEVLIRQLRIALGIYNDDSKHIIELVEALQAQLDKYRWIPADNPPDKFEWEDWYYTLDNGAVIPKVMQAQYIWLDEGSEVEWYRPITLPESEVK